jgi:GNAT superfamily N-acetyltransferase
MRAQEFISEISDEQLQRYLDRAGRQVDARQERMARVRDRLNKGYEIYHAETPNRIVHRFEARTPQEAKRYYDDFITKYESDRDYDLRLRRATGIMEFAPSSKRDDNDDVPDPIFVLANRWWNATDKQPQIEHVLNSMGWSIAQVESEDDAVQLQHRDGTTYFISADDFDPDLFESAEDYAGMQIRLSKDSDGVAVRALAGGKELGMAEFFFDKQGQLDPQTVWVDERYHGQGIAAAMYNFLKDKGYTIVRSWDQTDAGRGFWDKHQKAGAIVWENFADGKKPGRKGLSKRVGVDCKQPVTKLRSIAKNSSGEKQRMAHWCANMKSGKKK